jgi:hypothetical protein
MKLISKIGGIGMATSSIFANVKITDPKKAEVFINAMDAAANSPKRNLQTTNGFLVDNQEKIKEMFGERKNKKKQQDSVK